MSKEGVLEDLGGSSWSCAQTALNITEQSTALGQNKGSPWEILQYVGLAHISNRLKSHRWWYSFSPFYLVCVCKAKWFGLIQT